MRRAQSIPATLIALALLATNFSLASAAPKATNAKPKAGALCVKRNQVIVVKSSTFTCSKVGSKLIWKVQDTKVAAPNPGPIPTPTPSPTATKSSFVPPTKKPTKISELDPATAWYFAWKSMDEARDRNEKFKAQYKIVMGPTFKSEVRDVIIEGLDAGSSFWSDFWRPTEPMLVLLGTEKDLTFWRNELANTYDPRWHQSRDEPYQNVLNSFNRLGASSNFASASWFTNKPNMTFSYGTDLTAPRVRQNNWQTSPHEYTHIVQGVLGYAFDRSGMGPRWMGEGQAEHVGIFLTKDSPEDYLNYRNLRFANQWRSPEQSSLRSAKRIYEAIRVGSQNEIYNAHYSFSAAAMEALVAIHGHEGILNYFNRIRAGALWSEAFKESFGTSHEDFLREVSPYLAKLRSEVIGEAVIEEPIPKEYLDYLARKEKVYNAIRAINTPNSEIKFNFIYKIGANYPADIRELNIRQVNYSSAIFSYFLDKKIDTTIYLYSEKDEAELRALPVFRENPYFDPEIKPWFERWKQGLAMEHNIGLIAFYLVDSNGEGGHAGVGAASRANINTHRFYNKQVVPHEFFHVVQDYPFRIRKLRYDDRPAYDKAFPPIFREGSANMFSGAVTYENFTEYQKFFNDEIIGFKRALPNFIGSIKSEADVVETLGKMLRKDSHPNANETSYFLGALVFEWFVSEYGLAKYRELLHDPAYGGPFDELLKKVVGYDQAELHKRAAGYVLAALQNA